MADTHTPHQRHTHSLTDPYNIPALCFQSGVTSWVILGSIEDQMVKLEVICETTDLNKTSCLLCMPAISVSVALTL